MSENELKHVVSGYTELEQLLGEQRPKGWHDIAQGYLGDRYGAAPNNRVRRITTPTGESYVFTYKQRMPNGHNLEFEAEMTKPEFEEAWDFTTQRLIKRRCSIQHGPVRWDVDFYRWSRPYFVLAEAEMPADMQQPDEILPELEGRIVYTVPRDDDRFAAVRLADEDHVRALAQELGLL